LRLNVVAPTPAPPAGVSLFCFSVMKPHSNEQTLVEFALKRRTSIFKCNDFAVISSEKVNLGPGDNGDVITWYNPTPTVPIGNLGANGVTTNSFLNTYIFIIAWGTLIKSKQLEGHDFVIKADPDAVFLPDRLESHVVAHKGKPVYFPNCNMFPESPPAGPKLYGALEVYSREAIDLYGQDPSRCQNMNWHGWGEDYYMQQCMILLGVPGVADFTQVGDHRCIYAPCTDGSRVAFHDFKDIDSYNTCFKQAIGESV